LPVISSVEKQKKDRKRFNVFIDGEFSFSVSYLLALKYNLKSGLELSPDKLTELREEDKREQGKAYAYRLVERRVYTKAEMRHKLENRDIPENIILEILDSLEQYHYVDDSAYMDQYLESRHGYGYYYFLHKLQEKGIEKSRIKQRLEEFFAPGKEETAAEEALEKKVRSWPDLEPVKKKARALRFLQSRGFSQNIIYGLLNRIS